LSPPQREQIRKRLTREQLVPLFGKEFEHRTDLQQMPGKRLDIQNLTLTIITTLHELSLNKPQKILGRRALKCKTGQQINQRPPRTQAAYGQFVMAANTKAQFAALCGVAAIPASSGVRPLHRLSRGGDRHANAALHGIVLSRRNHKDPRTMAYFDKRPTEGLSDRDIVRCLKRHVANEIFALLANPEISTPQDHRCASGCKRCSWP
jgi:transposase